ncbi:MAG TPA: N(4)-(beta-N-acetylglucosaminyl)-L-asparaginase [Longimicrobiales bacterium]|nr:N(4)-(beta-N-acetylglucosaminyl)-L-asparaginase [Longimicrobiales bacterium]
MTTRRDFVRKTAGAGLGAAAMVSVPEAAASLSSREGIGAPALRRPLIRPAAVGSNNAAAAVAEAVRVMQNGGDTLEAVVRGVNIVELDPEDITVGYGGLPNEDGVVELDASVMHGPTRGAGAVGALQGVRTPSRVAVAVMRYTDHVMLVGEGARLFARRMGFDADDDLLTDESRRRWLEWRAQHSDDDDWLVPGESGEQVEGHTIDIGTRGRSADSEFGMLDSHDGVRPWGTINCDAIDAQGNLSGATTTSGLFFKLPGRVGDSPIIGAGLYVDNDVGAAGSTGRGEAVIKTAGSHTVVEAMRRGLSPTDACLEACRRIVTWTVEPRLLRPDGRPNFNVEFYALDKQGRNGGAAIWSGNTYALNRDGIASMPECAYMFERR